jgi:uncharacterized protein YhbP (UPF0306 family)
MTNTMDIKELIKEVLEQGYLMSLGTQDDGGVWVADVIYVFDDELNLYWMSSPDTRHSKAIESASAVAGTITISRVGEDNMGIQFSGIATKIQELRPDLVGQHFAKRQKPVPADPDSAMQGRSWYALKPTTIELIYEKHFGFKKQKLELN